MKRILIKISSIIILLTAVIYTVHPVTAHAGIVDFYCFFNPATCGGSFTASGFVNGTIAFIGNTILMISSLFVTYAGILLNVSIVLTLNIKAIYEASPAIDQIWLLIRNLSSMFIIFALVFTSVLTILDISKTSATQLIKNIIIAGLLINFSLFFTKTVIDASNLVSLQFYRAIVPNSVTIDKDNIKSIISSSWQSGGLSDIFMQNLKITSIYNNKKGLITGAADTDFLNIIIASVLGSILMILAAGSFAIMSFAFIIRVVVLILLMGFSPVYFVGIIFPQVKDSMSKKWLGWLTSQLTFMPVYLLLMYVSIRFLTGINGTGFFNQLDNAKSVTGSANGVLLSSIGLILQYFIAYFMLGIPLLVAFKMGGKSTEWGANAQKWVGGKFSSMFRNSVGATSQHLIGRGAMALQDKFVSSDFATRNPNISLITNSVLKNVASKEFLGSKGGYKKRLENYSNARAEFGKKEIKISDKYKNQYTKYETDIWDSKTKDIEKDLAAAESDFNNPAMTDEGKQKARKKYGELKTELDARNKAEKEGRKDKYLEAEALKKRKEEYAKNLESTRDFFTTKARKAAAKAIRDEINKSEDKKLLKALADLTKGENKDDDKGGNKGDSKDGTKDKK